MRARRATGCWIGLRSRSFWSGRRTALNAAWDLQIQAGALDEAEALDLLEAHGGSPYQPAELGAVTEGPGALPACFLGHAEVARPRQLEARRQGPRFDVRASHTRLLRAGPVPPRLLAVEWAAKEQLAREAGD